MDEDEKDKGRDFELKLTQLSERIADLKLEVPGLEDALGAEPPPEKPASVWAGLLSLPRAGPEAAAPAPVLPRKDWVFGPQPRRQPKALPAEASQRILLGTLWAAVTVTAAALWLRSGFWPLSLHQALSLPLNEASGLARAQGALYVAEKKKRLLFQLSEDGAKIEAVRRFPNASVGGLAWGEGEGFWSVDEAASRVLRHDLDQDCAVIQSHAEPGKTLGTLAVNGGSVWISDARAQTLHRYEPGEKLRPEARYALPKLALAGLQVEDGKLWALDSATSTVYVYDLKAEGDLRPMRAYPLARWLPRGAKPAGLVLEPRSLWLLSDSPAQLHRFDRRALSLLRRLGLLR